jgi:tetratricopeptide (TPR) repeat protein
MPQHVILFLAANPEGTSPLKLGEECAEIQREIKMAPHRADFRFESRWAVSIDELMRHLMELDPSVIHFSGHGDRQGLFLQDESAQLQPVSARALAMMVGAAARNPRVIVLNACYTAAHASALRDKVDCVVVMDGAIGDVAARAFATRFYGALGNRRSIGNAVAQGIAALAAKQLPDELLPHCVTRDGIGAEAIVLVPSIAPHSSLDTTAAGHRDFLPVAVQSPSLGTDMFIGRDREMDEIESLLTREDCVQLRAALDGLPGIGKTELARQLVARLSRSGTFPGGIYWFAAEQPDLRMQWAKIAEELGGPALQSLDERSTWAIRLVEQHAQRGQQVLIVLDNVESWAPPPGPMPEAAAIRVLVTTRVRWLHNSFRPFEVQPLALSHSRQLLDLIVGRRVASSDDLLTVLGGHVLSIELAACYLREYGISPGEYLGQLLSGKSPASAVADRTSYRATAESAFRLLWRRIPCDLRAAWVLAANLAPGWFSTELADVIGLDAERRRGLVRLHILERDGQGRHQMHRLLREFALVEMSDVSAARLAVYRGAVKLLGDGDPLLQFQRYARDSSCFEYLLDMSPDKPSSLAFRAAVGIALHQLGELSRARHIFERVLAFQARIYGDAHPKPVPSQNNLALLLRQVGELRPARTLLEKALSSVLQAYGEDHPEVATILGNLASLLRQLGDLSGARTLFERALASDAKSYGVHHPQAAITRANLAGLLQEQGKLSQARDLYEQALASQLAAYGADHPAVAATRSNLARVLQHLGDYAAAKNLFEQALASNIGIYGDDHPVVATTRANLAVLFSDAGKLSDARELLEHTLASNLKSFGNHHPEVAITRANLARVLSRSGHTRAALFQATEALASDMETYDPQHPRVRGHRHAVNRLLHKIGVGPEDPILGYWTYSRDQNSEHETIHSSATNFGRILPPARILISTALTLSRILLIDPIPGNTGSIDRFRRRGMAITIAPTIEDAASEASAARYDIVIFANHCEYPETAPELPATLRNHYPSLGKYVLAKLEYEDGNQGDRMSTEVARVSLPNDN